MSDPRPDAVPPDFIDEIPDPETVRRWIAESVRRTGLLRGLLRLARRKAAHNPNRKPARGEGGHAV